MFATTDSGIGLFPTALKWVRIIIVSYAEISISSNTEWEEGNFVS